MRAEFNLDKGRSAPKRFSERQYKDLLLHLHSDGAPSQFAFAMRTKEGRVIFAHNKDSRRSIIQSIASTWNSACPKCPAPYSLVLLANSSTRMSTWAAWDFDFHDSPNEAFNSSTQADLRAFVKHAEPLKNSGVYWIVEHSGRGWHCFLISRTPLFEESWTALRRQIESSACFKTPAEFLPVFKGRGKGIRAPGSANPNKGASEGRGLVSLIMWDNIPSQGVSLNNKTILLKVPGIGVKDACQSKAGLELLDRWKIRLPSTRYDSLLNLIAAGIHRFSKKALMQLAAMLYQRANPPCKTAYDTHMVEFETIYSASFEKFIVPKLSAEEQAVYNALPTQSQKDIFLVIQNFAQLRSGEFFFSTPTVGQQVLLTPQQVSKVRRDFERIGIIRRLPGEYQPGRTAYSYKWLLSSSSIIKSDGILIQGTECPKGAEM